MSVEDLMARIEQAKNNLQSAREVVSEAQGVLGIKEEAPPPREPEKKGLLGKMWDKVKDHGHTALDVAGFVPGLGTGADLINAGWYAAEGDYKNAAFSAAAAIPGAGDVFAAGKVAVKVAGAAGGTSAAMAFGKKILDKGLLDNADEAADIARVEDYASDGILSTDQIKHILDGDANGGGHGPGRGISGKTEYPSDWSDEDVIRRTLDVATHPDSTWTIQKGNADTGYTKKGELARWKVEGTREGIDMRVGVEPAGKGIITSFPTNVPKNP